jgi:hypothetical protein
VGLQISLLESLFFISGSQFVQTSTRPGHSARAKSAHTDFLPASVH